MRSFFENGRQPQKKIMQLKTLKIKTIVLALLPVYVLLIKAQSRKFTIIKTTKNAIYFVRILYLVWLCRFQLTQTRRHVGAQLIQNVSR